MKITAGKAERFIASPPVELRWFLLYGENEGLVRERCNILGRTFVEDLRDPFLVAELTGNDIIANPARLAEELAAISFTGGRRLIVVRGATDSLVKVIRTAFQDAVGDAIVIIQSSSLGPRSTLRKLAETSSLAAAVPCYAEDSASLERVIRESLRVYNVRASTDAISWLVARLGSDRAVARSEMEKLALFSGNDALVDLEMAISCIGDSTLGSLDDLIYSAASGEYEKVNDSLTRSFLSGMSAVGILRALTTHLMRLESASARISAGEEPANVLKSLKPPIFFKLERSFREQLKLWCKHKLSKGLRLTLEAEILCKGSGIPAEAVCGRTVLQIAGLARQDPRRA